LDQAKAQGQTPSLSAPDGTFAAGVHRVTELIPILMNDILATAPEDQKVRENIASIPMDTPATCEASMDAFLLGDHDCGVTPEGGPFSFEALLRPSRLCFCVLVLFLMMNGHSQ